MIETPRLKLRLHTIEDFDFSHGLWNEAQVYQFISKKPSSVQQSWGRLYNYLGHWQLRGYGYFLIEERSSGRAIGEIGLADFQRDLTPRLNLPYEAGWVIHPDFHGQGYASEAIEAILRWNEKRVGTQTYWCMIDAKNTASIALAAKFNFHFSQEAVYNGEAISLFTRLSF
jgi:RimJ/RimL family protein N-acetyltransferase